MIQIASMGQSSERSTPLIMRRYTLSSGNRSCMRSNIAHEKTIKLVDGQTVPQIRSCAILILTDVLACKDCVVELFTSRRH